MSCPTAITGHSGQFTGLYRTYRILQDLQDFTGLQDSGSAELDSTYI